MRKYIVLIILAAVLLSGCGADHSKTTPTPLATSAPTPTATSTPSPTPTAAPTEAPEQAPASVSIRECDEFEKWWLEVQYDVGIYDELAIVTIEYEHQLVTFYMGYLDGDWELICWCFG